MFRFRLISAPTLFSPRKGPNGWRGPWLLVKRIPPSHTSSESRVWILVLISPVLGQEGAPKGMPANTVITSQGVCLTQHRGVLSSASSSRWLIVYILSKLSQSTFHSSGTQVTDKCQWASIRRYILCIPVLLCALRTPASFTSSNPFLKS